MDDSRHPELAAASMSIVAALLATVAVALAIATPSGAGARTAPEPAAADAAHVEHVE